MEVLLIPTSKMSYHNSVLLNESVDGLDLKGSEVVVDVTFGGGGHSREILKKLNENGRLFGFDQDEDAVENVPDDKRFTLIKHNFRYFDIATVFSSENPMHMGMSKAYYSHFNGRVLFLSFHDCQ